MGWGSELQLADMSTESSSRSESLAIQVCRGCNRQRQDFQNQDCETHYKTQLQSELNVGSLVSLQRDGVVGSRRLGWECRTGRVALFMFADKALNIWLHYFWPPSRYADAGYSAQQCCACVWLLCA